MIILSRDKLWYSGILRFFFFLSITYNTRKGRGLDCIRFFRGQNATWRLNADCLHICVQRFLKAVSNCEFVKKFLSVYAFLKKAIKNPDWCWNVNAVLMCWSTLFLYNFNFPVGSITLYRYNINELFLSGNHLVFMHVSVVSVCSQFIYYFFIY